MVEDNDENGEASLTPQPMMNAMMIRLVDFPYYYRIVVVITTSFRSAVDTTYSCVMAIVIVNAISNALASVATAASDCSSAPSP